MQIDTDQEPALNLRPNFVILIVGGSVAALLSFIYLPWSLALASIVLSLLMIAGADVDARTFLLPDAVTYGAILSGLIAAAFLDPTDPGLSLAAAVLRAAGIACLLALLRYMYMRFRNAEGLGLGDVKLAAAVGAWLPLETISICFFIATTAALLSVVVRQCREALEGMRLPLGAFLCPALWLVFFTNSLFR